MSVVKRIIQDSIEKVKVDELLADEYEQAGYGGITLTKTPLGTQINLYAMRPGRVIGKRGRAIKEASERLENELGLPNPQITVVEVEVPELNPRIMAARIANALERGVHYRRAIFWSLRRTMESGAIGCEILLKGKLRSDRGRYEKVSDGYIPKSGDPALTYVKSATIHVKQKKGTFGVTVTIVPPDAKFPDKVDLTGLPVIEYPEEEVVLPEGVEPEAPEAAPEADVGAPEPTPAETVVAEELVEAEAPMLEPSEAEVAEIVSEESELPKEEEIEVGAVVTAPADSQVTPEPAEAEQPEAEAEVDVEAVPIAEKVEPVEIEPEPPVEEVKAPDAEPAEEEAEISETEVETVEASEDEKKEEEA
jgi:small subunit ribosomal protein S3